jgi:hypothetical protein
MRGRPTPPTPGRRGSARARPGRGQTSPQVRAHDACSRARTDHPPQPGHAGGAKRTPRIDPVSLLVTSTKKATAHTAFCRAVAAAIYRCCSATAPLGPRSRVRTPRSFRRWPPREHRSQEREQHTARGVFARAQQATTDLARRPQFRNHLASESRGRRRRELRCWGGPALCPPLSPGPPLRGDCRSRRLLALAEPARVSKRVRTSAQLPDRLLMLGSDRCRLANSANGPARASAQKEPSQQTPPDDRSRRQAITARRPRA